MKDDSRLVRNCISGYIYDSSPVDFTSDFGARFGLPSTILKMPGSTKLVSWVAKGVASGLDALYLTRFEFQRTEYWRTLYSSVVSSYLICSPSNLSVSFCIINATSFLSSFVRVWELRFSFYAPNMMILLHIRLFAIFLTVYKILGLMLNFWNGITPFMQVCPLIFSLFHYQDFMV